MFNFFRKDKFNKKIPTEYSHLINQQQYILLLDIAQQFFKDKGEEVLKIDNGYITAKEEGGEEMKYGLDNIVRLLSPEPQENWESIIYTHFNKVNSSDSHLVYYRKDYEAVKPFLKVLVKDDAILNHEFAADIIYKVDLPGTCTILVMDYDNQFRYLRKEDIIEWEASIDEIFLAALDNIAEEEVTINQVEHEEAIEMFLFFSGDFSAAKMLQFERNAHFALGKYGSVIAIPTKGTAFVSPINHNNVIGILEILTKPVAQFFNQDPGNITTSIYWYYENTFQQFPETQSDKEGYITIGIPEALVLLISEEHE